MQNLSLFGARHFDFNLLNTGNTRLIVFQNGRHLSSEKALQELVLLTILKGLHVYICNFAIQESHSLLTKLPRLFP